MNFIQDYNSNLKFGKIKSTELNPTNNISSNSDRPFDNLKFHTILWIIIIIIIIGLIIYYFSKNNEKLTNNNSINFQNDLIMIYNDKCPYSNKMKTELIGVLNYLNGKKIKFVQYDSTKGIYIQNKYGITGTPVFIDFKNNVPETTILGYNTIKMLHEKLNLKNKKSSNKISSNEENNNNKYNEVLLIGNRQCGFCNKQIQFFDKNNINYRFINSNDSEGISYMKKYEANGVPLIILKNNDSEIHHIGYNENLPL